MCGECLRFEFGYWWSMDDDIITYHTSHNKYNFQISSWCDGWCHSIWTNHNTCVISMCLPHAQYSQIKSIHINQHTDWLQTSRCTNLTLRHAGRWHHIFLITASTYVHNWLVYLSVLQRHFCQNLVHDLVLYMRNYAESFIFSSIIAVVLVSRFKSAASTSILYGVPTCLALKNK